MGISLDWRDEARLSIERIALLNAVKHGGRADAKPVMGRLLAERPDLKPAVKEVASLVAEVVAEVNSLSLPEMERLVEELGILPVSTEPAVEERGLPPLPGVEQAGQVVTRFSPNPDGPLQLGNCRAIILSHDYARMYGGKFLLRFEDTDPKLKKPVLEFYDMIRQDLTWLECRWDGEVIQSDRLPLYYEHAERLILLGGAYVCLCARDAFRALAIRSKPCPDRELRPEEHANRWRRMLEGYYDEGKALVRVRTDLRHPNPAVRDWPALRIIDPQKHPHPRTGSQYRVWPLYNFACGVDDHLMNITYIIRGKEHLTNTIRQQYMYAHFGWQYPTALHYGRLKIAGSSLSKSKMVQAMAQGIYRGFADPRLATLAALRRRGITPQALRRLFVELGPRPIDATISWENLYAYNRRVIDPKSNRYFFVCDPVPMLVKGVHKDHVATPYLHPDRPELGRRSIIVQAKNGVAQLYVARSDLRVLRPAGVVRLMELFNVEVEHVDGDVEARFHSSSYAEARQVRAPLIHWLPRGDNLAAVVIMPTAEEVSGLVESNITRESLGSIVQLVRFGFGRLDEFRGGSLIVYYAHA